MKQYEPHKHTLNRTVSRTYNAWRNMIQRCTNPNRPDYRYYGARGIKVCTAWKKSFSKFLEDMGEAPEGKSLDRRKNSKGYSKGNCRWATKDEQMQNTRATVLLTCQGKTLGLTAWARYLGLNKSSLQGRLKRGWSIEKTLTTGAKNEY